jgi:lipopolysaccharide/colanic/teichoic acid biosynthesis glycosyltransferase
MHSTQQGTKRVLDILLAIVGTIILLPLILLTAIILKFTSSGPVFFLQERVGINEVISRRNRAAA